MGKRHCVIVTPAPPGSRAGNRNTAVRWAGILRDLGLRVDIATDWHDGSHDLMIALHAGKSRAAMRAWRYSRGAWPLILALTGTDIYRDIRIDADTAAMLDGADRLLVLQAAALAELTTAQRGKAAVIHQSETARGPWQPLRRQTRFSVIGHLREEKDPLRAALALDLLRKTGDIDNIRVTQAGGALAPQWAKEAAALMRKVPGYEWVGELAHWRALNMLRRSHALIISSRLEGGAHVVSEAIVHGVPVLASRIPGNVGLLGEDYAGYFDVENTAALARLMLRVHDDAGFVAALHAAVCARQPLFTPEAEREAWRRLLAGL